MKNRVYGVVAMLGISMAACTKDNDGVKAEIETTLPTIELTSMGLLTQIGPFATTDAIQITFGGAITNSEADAFDIAWYDAPTTGTPARIDSVHFKSWTEAAATANGNNSIVTTLTAATYPNTNTISGNVVLKLSKLPAGNKSYTLRLYARTKDGKMATVSVSRFITMK